MKVEDLINMLQKSNPQDEVRFYSFHQEEHFFDDYSIEKVQLFIEDCSQGEKGLEIILG
jgi:hypothetical protein